MLVQKAFQNTRGSVSVLSALFFTAMVGVAAFSLQSAQLYIVKLKSQRVADLASLAAANTTSPIVNGAVSTTAAATALNIATINGFGSSSIVTSVASSPTNDGNQTISTTISQNTPILFAGLGNKTAYGVSAASLTEIKSESGPCITSITWQTAVYLGANVQGAKCSIYANAYLYGDNLSKISVGNIFVGISSSAESIWVLLTSLLHPVLNNFNFNASITDPLNGNSSTTAIANHLDAMASWPYGTANPVPIPFVTGGTLYNFNGATKTFSGSGVSDPSCITPVVLGGMTLTGTNTITFGSGCFVVNGSITQLSGNTTFAMAPGASVNLILTGSIINYSGTMSFGNASYAVGGQISNFGASLSFGDGQKEINGGIFNNAGQMSFGTGPYYIWGGGVTNAISSSLTFGNGPFYVYLGTISNFGTATFGNGPYYFYIGGINTGLGSSTIFGTGTMDFYWGSVNLSGNTTFGSGGSASAGSMMLSFYAGSFTVWNGNLTAAGVTFGLTTGVVGLYGTGTINATAPTSANPTYGYQNILFDVTGINIPAGNFNGGSTDIGGLFNLVQTGGTTDTLSGIIYVPGSFIAIGGTQTVSAANGGCLQIVGSGVFVWGALNLNPLPCQNSQSSGTVAIVQ